MSSGLLRYGINTDFVFIGLYTASIFKRLQSASNLALDADVRGALPAVQTSLFVGNVRNMNCVL